jgi:hypothetical protein
MRLGRASRYTRGKEITRRGRGIWGRRRLALHAREGDHPLALLVHTGHCDRPAPRRLFEMVLEPLRPSGAPLVFDRPLGVDHHGASRLRYLGSGHPRRKITIPNFAVCSAFALLVVGCCSYGAWLLASRGEAEKSTTRFLLFSVNILISQFPLRLPGLPVGLGMVLKAALARGGDAAPRSSPLWPVPRSWLKIGLTIFS